MGQRRPIAVSAPCPLFLRERPNCCVTASDVTRSRYRSRAARGTARSRLESFQMSNILRQRSVDICIGLISRGLSSARVGVSRTGRSRYSTRRPIAERLVVVADEKSTLPSWKNVKKALLTFDRTGLLGLLQDLYAVSRDNQAFIHARLGLGPDQLAS